MAYFDGFAFKENAQEIATRYRIRYNELALIGCLSKGSIEFYDKQYSYGKNSGSGKVLDKEILKRLDEFDIALLGDGGNLCFGGGATLNKETGEFTYYYYTD